MNADVLDYLKRRIEEDRKAFLEQLGRGMAGDYPAYREVVGNIAALDSVLNAILDINKKLEQDDE